MNLNHILELCRKSLRNVTEIKNYAKGHIYSSYLNNESKFPCITLFDISGSSPMNIKGAALVIVQVKIWTKNNANPNSELKGIYSYIIDNFAQTHVEDDNIKMTITLGIPNGQHPPVIKETFNGNDIYSLACKFHCRAINA